MRLVDHMARPVEEPCAACGGATRQGYTCRCSVPGVANPMTLERLGMEATREQWAHVAPGSDRVASSPLVRCYPVPIATIQPRNEIPPWARRFFARYERVLEIPPYQPGPLDVARVFVWSMLAFLPLVYLVARLLWNGPGPQIVPHARQLEERVP